MRRVELIKENKWEYKELLLIGDEDENMIARYLDRGSLYVLFDDDRARCVCVVTDEGEGILEIKNIATAPDSERRGYARRMIEFIEDHYKGKFNLIQVGTGDSPMTVPFYERCGFSPSHVIKNFFVDNYDHPIIEAGVQLVDMIYFRKSIPV